MDISLLAVTGISNVDVAIATARFGVGSFFAISGFNKLFDKGRHQSIVNNLTKNHIPNIKVMQWWVPAWEFASGLALALGYLGAFNAAVLMIICIVACCCEAREKVERFNPINGSDRVADYLYLPEVLYLLLLSINLFAGSGRYSLDYAIFGG